MMILIGVMKDTTTLMSFSV